MQRTHRKDQLAPLEFSPHQVKLGNHREARAAVRQREFICAMEQQVLLSLSLPITSPLLRVGEEKRLELLLKTSDYNPETSVSM